MWQRDLAAIRSDAVLDSLSSDERDTWRKLWSDIDTLIDGDPRTRLEKARATSIARNGRRGPRSTRRSWIWFEYAATQLLAGDREGYRRSRKHMLKEINPDTMRSYYVARACTLATDSLDMNEPIRASAKELQFYKVQFWSSSPTRAASWRRGASSARGDPSAAAAGT